MPLGALIGAGASIGSALLGRQKPQPTTQTQATTASFGPGQERVNRWVSKQLKYLLKQGPQVLPEERTQGMQHINTVYDAMLNRLETDAARRGFGGSGVEGRDMRMTERGRAQEAGDLFAQLQQQAWQRYLPLMQMGIGYARPWNQTTVTEGMIPGQSVGQALAPAVGSIGSDIATQLFMRDMMKQQAPLPTPSVTLPGVMGMMPGYGFSR